MKIIISGLGIALFSLSALAADFVQGVIKNDTNYDLVAYETVALTSGFVTKALLDMPHGETGTFEASHSWGWPLYTIDLQAKFYVVDNNQNPREECLFQIISAHTHLGWVDINAHCNPVVPVRLASQRVHFDDQSLDYTNSVVNPHVSIRLQKGHGPDIATSLG